MDEQSCPRCKTTKYRNPSLKLMVNVCGHSLCENCVELLFIRGSGACPECGVALRRSNFRVQLFEDPYVEKEVDIRKRILKDFNKKEEDFESLNDYNDYLEMVETIIFNLTNDIDVDATRKQVEMYKKENQQQIKVNRVKKDKDQEYLEALIEQEKIEQEENRHRVQQEEIQQKRDKRKNKEALIDELMFSDLSADRILAAHKQELSDKQEKEASAVPRVRQTAFSSGLRIGKQDMFIPVPKKVEGELYSYEDFTQDHMGPDIPGIELLAQEGYLTHIRKETGSELGGGFISEIACERALTEAFSGLFYSYEPVHEHTTIVESGQSSSTQALTT